MSGALMPRHTGGTPVPRKTHEWAAHATALPNLDVHGLNHVAGVAAAVPLGVGLLFAGGARRASHEAMIAALRLPGETPAPPGILAEIRVESGGGPGGAAVGGNFDGLDAAAAVEGEALNFIRGAGGDRFVGLGADEQRADGHPV